jgi:hypothetical protein
MDILWKTFTLSSDSANGAPAIDRKRRQCAVVLPIHSQAVAGHGGDACGSSPSPGGGGSASMREAQCAAGWDGATSAAQRMNIHPTPTRVSRVSTLPLQGRVKRSALAFHNLKFPPEREDPPGGTTGRVKLYGRWGGWALAPYTASLGRDNRSHRCWSQKAPRTFKSRVNFFNFFGQVISAKKGRKLLRGGVIGLATGRFFRRHGGRRRAQIPRCGSGLWLRNFYGGRLV